MPAQEPKHDWATHGMTEREMKSRIKSHYAMAKKSFETWDRTKVPDAFLTPEFKTWMKNNPTSPWVTGGGWDKLVNQQTSALMAKHRGTKRADTGYKMSKALKKNQLSKLQKSISKLTSGY